MEKKDPKKEQLDGKTPVLLVHAYLSKPSTFIPLKKRMKDQGIQSVYTIDLGKPWNSLEDHAKKVSQKIEEIKCATDQEKVILVGHSMGGIVSLNYAMDNKTSVAGVVTIGSPVKGTKMAAFGVGQAALDMRVGSSFLQKLSEKIEDNGLVPVHHIASITDLVVVPRNHAYFEGLEMHTVFKTGSLGHLYMIYSKRVSNNVIEQVKHFRSAA